MPNQCCQQNNILALVVLVLRRRDGEKNTARKFPNAANVNRFYKMQSRKSKYKVGILPYPE